MPNIQVKAQRRDILARRVHEYAVSLFGQGIINRLTAAEQKDPRSFLPVPRDQHEFTTTVSIFARLLEKEGAELAGIKIFDKRVSIQIANMGFEYSGAEVHLCFSVPGGEGFFIRSFKGDSTGERKIKERSDHFEYVILSPADYPRLYGSVVFGRRSPFVDETYHPGSASGVTLEDIAEAARNSRTITKPIETHYGVIAYDSEKKEISFTDKRGKKCAYSGISRSFDVGQDADKVLLDNFHAAVQVSSKLLFFIPTNIILPFEHDFQVFYREFDKRKPSVAPDVVAPALEPPISVQTKFGKVVYDPSKGNVFLLDTGRKPLFRYSLRESKIYTTKGIVSRSDDIINLRQAVKEAATLNGALESISFHLDMAVEFLDIESTLGEDNFSSPPPPTGQEELVPITVEAVSFRLTRISAWNIFSNKATISFTCGSCSNNHVLSIDDFLHPPNQRQCSSCNTMNDFGRYLK